MLHVTAAGDFAPQVKGSILRFSARGVGRHGVTPRLVLNAQDASRPMYYVGEGDDDECADLAQLPFDRFGHNMYAKDLSGLSTPARPHTIPPDAPWPVPKDL